MATRSRIRVAAQSFVEAMAASVEPLWSCYNGFVEIVNFGPHHSQIGGRGERPHCRHLSYFGPVGGPYTEQVGDLVRMCNAAQCQACKSFVLVVGWRRINQGNVGYTFEACYPLGKPDDKVDAAVPDTIAADFREALRCRWVDAYKATVTMCGRAIQGSAAALGAEGGRLVDQIDDLRQKGIITEPLRKFAHEVRLVRNDGAHPDKDGLASVTEKDADDIIAFTREYLHHVYVMPAMLAARYPAPATVAPASS